MTDQSNDILRDDPTKLRPRKSADAYRTISEVADELHVPQHVLRFWETKFPRIKPLKRGGGRRYYRPDDVVLLRRIANLLYIQGYTIKGVQRLLKEGGGALHDEIPPASEEERNAAAAERAQASSPAPLKPAPQPDLPALRITEPTHHALPQSSLVQYAPAQGAQLNAQLRSILVATLAALEQLQADLTG